MSLVDSVKLVRFLPELNKAADAMTENGYKDVRKTVTKNCYTVSGVSKSGSVVTEFWDAVRNVHIFKTENRFGNQKCVSELVRTKLDGTPFDFYSKSTLTAPDYEITHLYSDSPKMIYKRFFDKVLNKIQYSKKVGEGEWEPLFKKPSTVISKEKQQEGLRIRHTVTESDGSVSTYLLNPKTQCLYKRNVTKDGKTEYYKVTQNGVINLFNK